MGALRKESEKLTKEVRKYKEWNFLQYILEWGEPVGRENLIWREKAKIGCLWTHLDFIEGLIEFIKDLIARKIDF